MSNTNVSSEQLRKAAADFLIRTKPYFDVLNAIAVNKTPTINYDITTNFYSISCGEDTEEEKELKRIISGIRDDCSKNLLKY
jgi:hypothetical protein